MITADKTRMRQLTSETKVASLSWLHPLSPSYTLNSAVSDEIDSDSILKYKDLLIIDFYL